MKHACLLMILAVLTGATLTAQSSATAPAADAESKTKRITITTTTTDDNGKTITETWIAEGENPSAILKDMAVQPDKIQKVKVEFNEHDANGERLFLFKSAGNTTVVEGMLGDAHEADQVRETVLTIVNRDLNTNGAHHAFVHAGKSYRSNCAAMGVWITSDREGKGARVTGLIENGGAKTAGLDAGDVIRRIDEFEISDYGTLHLAMSHFRPGDVVKVEFERKGAAQHTAVTLKDWAELPGHEWRSGGKDCAREELPVQENDDPVMSQQQPYASQIHPLELQHALIYPNPTDGLFSLSFESEPGPLTVSVSDATGKVIFQERSENGNGVYNRDIDLKSSPDGNYIITVRQGEKIFTQQVSKQ